VEQAKLSAWPTHRHDLAIDGAILIAQAASLALSDKEVSPASLAEALVPCCSTIVFEKRLEALREAKSPDDLDPLGNGIEAHESVVTALGCFAFYPDRFQEAIACALWRGGDTDTIGAMAGALVGARVGSDVEAGMHWIAWRTESRSWSISASWRGGWPAEFQRSESIGASCPSSLPYHDGAAVVCLRNNMVNKKNSSQSLRRAAV